jgi:hypothetical protein
VRLGEHTLIEARAKPKRVGWFNFGFRIRLPATKKPVAFQAGIRYHGRLSQLSPGVNCGLKLFPWATRNKQQPTLSSVFHNSIDGGEANEKPDLSFFA